MSFSFAQFLVFMVWGALIGYLIALALDRRKRTRKQDSAELERERARQAVIARSCRDGDKLLVDAYMALDRASAEARKIARGLES